MTEQMTTTLKLNPVRAAAVVKALGHPLRVRVLEKLAVAEKPVSPSELAEDVGAPLGNVSYHVRMLVRLGALAPPRRRGTRQVRGALEHFYEITPLGRAAVELLAEITPEDQE